MDKINYQNLPRTTTPVNATNLNQLQTNVENAINTKQDAMVSGTWTPVLSTAEAASANPTVDYTITGAADRGSYKKIGNLVFISFYIRGRITALNGTDNYAAISGLPFTPKTLGTGENVISLGMQYNCINGDPTNRWCFHYI